MATKRKNKSGTKWEYIIKRAKLLPKPIYLTFDDEAEGDAYVARLEAMLDKGVVPESLTPETAKYRLLGEIIKDYLQHNSIPDSDKKLLNVQYARIGMTPIRDINYQWVQKWVEFMKMELNLAPGTIRHHAGALARCFDWAGNMNITEFVSNPIRQLPKRYAQYTDKDTKLASAFDDEHVRREDVQRDRRLEPGEEERIRQTLKTYSPKGRHQDRWTVQRPCIEMMFDLALETAMRMREIYTLTLDQVDMKQRTIFLDRTKNGSKRQVPLTTVAQAKLAEYQRKVIAGEVGDFAFDEGRLFPWWDGKTLDEDYLRKLTVKLSVQYTRLFSTAGCQDLRFHDMRHEATSRFFERTTMQDFEIMKITGHSSTRMLARYGNLRGSTLADKLW